MADTDDVEVEAYAEAYVEDDDDDDVETGYKVEEQDPGLAVEAGAEEDYEEDLGEAGKPMVMNPLDSMDGYTMLVTLLVVNIVEFVAAIVFTANLVGGDVNPDFGLGVWAVVGGLFSIITVVVLLILKKCNETASVKIAPWLSAWLLLLWVAIVMPCTFQPPFAAFGNGYVGAWASLVVAGTLTARAFADKAASIRKVSLVPDQNCCRTCPFCSVLCRRSVAAKQREALNMNAHVAVFVLARPLSHRHNPTQASGRWFVVWPQQLS